MNDKHDSGNSKQGSNDCIVIMGYHVTEHVLLTLSLPIVPLIDFTLSNARRFYSSVGNPTGVKGLSTYANFRLFAFLFKSFSVLKVSKSTILFK